MDRLRKSFGPDGGSGNSRGNNSGGGFRAADQLFRYVAYILNVFAMNVVLSPFADNHAAEIASWPVSADEAKAWAGNPRSNV